MPFQIIVNSFTLYALFSDDSRILFFREKSDSVFDVLTIIALLSFSFEIVASSLVKKDYFNSFFFWLDLVSTLSLLFDISFLFGGIFTDNAE